LTYLQDQRPLYLRRPGEGHDEALFADGAFIERYTEALGVMRQDPEQAIELFRQTLRLGPSDFAMPHCWIGRLLYESGRLQEAAQHLVQALAIDETVVMAWAHLALIELMEEGAGDAVTMARTAVELAPRSHFCRYVLGRVLMAQDPVAALRELTIAVKLGGPQTGDALYRLALVFERDHNPQAARVAWTALLELQPGDPRALRALSPQP
jgi:tetratricopeptide (TPR) repeat protein